MAITIKDIAEAANVSKAAVSYVINQRPGVSDETRQRVLQIMKELNYRPNVIARGLAGQPTEMLGLVIPDITDMFYVDIIRGVEARANEAGYVLNLCTTHAEREREQNVVDMFTSGRVDGVILMTYFLERDYLRKLTKRSVPFVTLDSPYNDKSIYSITVDNEQVGYLGTNHLISLGHKEIAFIHGSSNGSHSSDQRFTGYRRALKDRGIPFNPELIKRGKFLKSGGYRAAKELLSSQPRPTAIYAANDQMALGALAAAVELGFRVPEDVSILGVDDIEAASLVDPALTTIKQPTYEMGRLAVEILLRLRAGESFEPRQVSLQPTLVVRQSCGPAQSSSKK